MIARRDVLASLMSIVATRAVWAEDSAASYSDPRAADKWMRGLLQAKDPSGPLRVGRFADPVYFLTQGIGWVPRAELKNDYPPVQAPLGFVTDFASIPRLFWSLLKPDGRYAFAAVIHDYLYWDQSIPRDVSDDILAFCMEEFSVSPGTVWAIHKGVRIGGQQAWIENARLKSVGERRVLRRFPEDPMVTWADWKVRSDVY